MEGRKGEPQLVYSHYVWGRQAAQQYTSLVVIGWWECHHSCTTHQHTQSSSPLHFGSSSKLFHPQLSWRVHGARGSCAHSSCCSEVYTFNIYVFITFSLVLTSSLVLFMYYLIYSDMRLYLHVFLRRYGLKLKLGEVRGVLILQALWQTYWLVSEFMV